MSITIVICTKNRPTPLKGCLAAVARLSPAPDQVIVVDNSPGDTFTQEVAREFGARYMLEPRPGLRRARYLALANCNTTFAAFLTDDAQPARDWLGALLTSRAAALTARRARRIKPTVLHEARRRAFPPNRSTSAVFLEKSAMRAQTQPEVVRLASRPTKERPATAELEPSVPQYRDS